MGIVITMDAERMNHRNDIESWLNQLEGQLQHIETDEYQRGLTTDELEEKGFIGNRPMSINRTAVTDDATEEGLLFADGAGFKRFESAAAFESAAIADLNGIPPVRQNQVFATRPLGCKVVLVAGKNVRREIREDHEMYLAEIDGVAIIAGNGIHVMSTDVDFSVELTVSADRMTVTMNAVPGSGKGERLSPDPVLAALQAQAVRFGILHNVIAEKTAAAAASGEALLNVMAAQGQPPVPGRKGTVEYAFDNGAEGNDFRILPDGKVDYRSTCRISMTEKGALLATVVKPEPGLPGMDVLGVPVPAPEGEPARLTAGNGVKVSEDGTKFYAEIAGSILLNGTVIEVLNTYVVNGDVDYSTGNINFNGNVVVHGNILDGFEVKADGDIVIAKNVEAARIEAGRDVIIRGGVLGRGRGLVTAGRHIRAEYAQNARLEAQGDVRLNNFAINSYICASGLLLLRDGRGSVMGGEVFAQKGIDVRSLGSENGVKTCVTAGTDYLVQRKIAELDLAISFCSNNIQKIDLSLKGAAGAIDTIASLPSQRRALLQKVVEKRRDLAANMNTMTAKRADLVLMSRDTGECLVKVSRECFPDVHIRIKDIVMAVGAKRSAVRFYEDKKNGEIAVGPY